MKEETGVHQRRTRFIKEYLLDRNATRAAIAAGYSEKGASVAGYTLLRNPKIREEINKKDEELNKKYDLSAERIKEEIARLCYYDPAAFFNPDGTPKAINDLDEDSRRAISGFDVAELFSGSGEDRSAVGYIKKVKLIDKAKALELAAKIQRLLVDRQEVTGPDGGPVAMSLKVTFVIPNAENS